MMRHRIPYNWQTLRECGFVCADFAPARPLSPAPAGRKIPANTDGWQDECQSPTSSEDIASLPHCNHPSKPSRPTVPSAARGATHSSITATKLPKNDLLLHYSLVAGFLFDHSAKITEIS